MKRLAVLLLAALLLAGGEVRAQGLSLEEMSPQQIQDELVSMIWERGPGTFSLPRSSSTIVLDEGQEILLGETAARYDYLTGGIETPETEAIVWNAADDSMTYFSFYGVGYVTEEDWDRVDPVEFMTQIKEAGVQANVERERVGIDPFYISDWRQQPTFKTATHTAYWATDVTNIQTQWVNAVAIRLSRAGYHQIVWAGGGDGFAAAQSTLGGLLDTHQYDSGYRYEDHVEGDPLADMSIGSLAAATMGVDLSGGAIAVAIGAAILFLKKGWIVILPVVAGIVALLRRRQKKQAVTATNTPLDGPPPPAIS